MRQTAARFCKLAALAGCGALLLTGALHAQRRSWSERPASPQTAHSRMFSQRPGGPAEGIQHVILVSVDGLMPETYLHPETHGLQIPTLREIVKNGAYSEGARGVFPTVTYPSHTSMVTGTNPGTHGIVANYPFDPFGALPGAWRWYSEDIRVPTLWSVARAKGLKTAMVNWPVSVGAQATAISPEFWRQVQATPEDAKLNFAISTPGLLDAVARRFPDFRAKFLPPRLEDKVPTDIAVHVIETQKPNLLLLHIIEVDHWEHEDGPFTGRAIGAIETADQQIARLIAAAKKAGIWNQTILVVVSDHGMARTTQRLRPGVWLKEKGLVTLDDKNKVTDWKAYVLGSSGSAYVYVKEPGDEQTRQTVRELFQQAAGQPGSGIARVFTHEQIVAMGGDPEAFLAVEAADGWAIAEGVLGDAVGANTSAGEHGYLPERPEMRPSLLVYGPLIGHAKIPNARLIDVGPTIARWLGLKLEKAEGTALEVPLRKSVAAATNSLRP